MTNIMYPSIAGRRSSGSIQGIGGFGCHASFGEVVRIRRREPVRRLLHGAVVVVDDLTPDLIGFLSGAAAVVVASDGPWEAALPGLLLDDLRRSGVGVLLAALDIPVVWGVGGGVAQLTDYDLAEVDPHAATVWSLELP